jgi:hypothetical protein
MTARQEAILFGLTQYHGKPCCTCKATLKWVVSRSCVGCIAGAVKVWSKTPKGRAKSKGYQAKYSRTPKGIAARKRGQAKYDQTPKGKATRARQREKVQAERLVMAEGSAE